MMMIEFRGNLIKDIAKNYSFIEEQSIRKSVSPGEVQDTSLSQTVQIVA